MASHRSASWCDQMLSSPKSMMETCRLIRQGGWSRTKKEDTDFKQHCLPLHQYHLLEPLPRQGASSSSSSGAAFAWLQSCALPRDASGWQRIRPSVTGGTPDACPSSGQSASCNPPHPLPGNTNIS